MKVKKTAGWDDNLLQELVKNSTLYSEHLLKEKILKLSTYPWRKLYKAEFIKKNRIFFPEDDIFYEDIAFHWFTTLPAKRFTFVERPLVIHVFQRKGQTTYLDFDYNRAVSYLKLASILNNFLNKKGYWIEYKLSYVSDLFNLLKWSSKDFYQNYKVMMTNGIHLIPKLSLKELHNLQELRRERKFKILTYFLFLVMCPYSSFLIRTFILKSKSYIKKYFK